MCYSLHHVEPDSNYALSSASLLINRAGSSDLDVVRLAPLDRDDWDAFGLKLPTYFGTIVGQYLFHRFITQSIAGAVGEAKKALTAWMTEQCVVNATIALPDNNRSLTRFLSAFPIP